MVDYRNRQVPHATIAGDSVAVDDLDDLQFDSLMPSFARRASRTYWTPAAVARSAADLFGELGASRVLDVGAGPGKFCLIAAARRSEIAFYGVDHRPRLVAVSRALSREMGVVNASFELGDATRLPWAPFDGIYVFNSFAENSFAIADRFDDTVELSDARRVAEMLAVERNLAGMPIGTTLTTYHGLGGPIPGSYERIHAQRAGTGWLQVWRRTTLKPSDSFWLEEGGEFYVATAAEVGRFLSDRLEQQW